MLKKITSICLVFLIIILVFGIIPTSAQENVTRSGYTATDYETLHSLMMGDARFTDSNLLYGLTPRRVYTFGDGYSAETDWIKTAENIGENGENAYSYFGSHRLGDIYTERFYSLTDGVIDPVGANNNDLSVDSGIWARTKTNHYLGIEYDLGSVCSIEELSICFTTLVYNHARNIRGYEIYLSSSLETLYSSGADFSITDNLYGVNKLAFSNGTTARYFAIRITLCDDGVCTGSVYPRMKELAMKGSRETSNSGAVSFYQSNLTSGASSNAYFMDGEELSSPKNLLNGISPKLSYTDSSGTAEYSIVPSGYTNGIFDDSYVNGRFLGSTFMNDSTYSDVLWELGETRRASELWLSFRPELDNCFISPKYAVFAGNDLGSLYSSPILTVDCNTSNINKVMFSEREVRYLAVRFIVPNSAEAYTKYGESNLRVSICEAALVGVPKIKPALSVIDMSNNALNISIGGAETIKFAGEKTEISIPKTAICDNAAYAFEKIEQNSEEIEILDNGDNYTAEIIVSEIPAKIYYEKAYKVDYSNVYIANNQTIEIEESKVSSVYKSGEEYTINSDSTINVDGMEYNLSGWQIGSQFVEAGDKLSYTFVIDSDVKVSSVYAPSGNGSYPAIFQDKNGETLKVFFIPADKTIAETISQKELSAISVPYIFGYSFSGLWSVDLNEAWNTSVVITPVYLQKTEEYKVTISAQEVFARFDQKLTISSDNDSFSSWNSGDEIISSDAQYTFYTPGNIKITESEFGTKTQSEHSAFITNGEFYKDENGYRNLSVMAGISNISEADFIECGVIFVREMPEAWFDNFKIGLDKSLYKGIKKYPSGKSFMITLSKTSTSAERYARAYVKYKLNNREITEYSRSYISLKEGAVSEPKMDKMDISKFSSHPKIPLYGENAIPNYNAKFAAVQVQYSNDGNGNLTDNNPTITPYLVEGAKSCVVIYPGGGFYARSDAGEGINIAKAYNDAGISAFVCRYRVGNGSDYANGYDGESIILDAQRAVQFVRYNAKEFGIDPNKIAVAGFSAGGLLALTTSQKQAKAGIVGDAIERISNKPNATVLGYARTNLAPGTGGAAMHNILALKYPSEQKQEILDYWSPNLNVTSDLSPTFSWGSKADTTDPIVYHTNVYCSELEKAGVEYQEVIYETTPHGKGLSIGYDAEGWHELSVQFLKKYGF